MVLNMNKMQSSHSGYFTANQEPLSLTSTSESITQTQEFSEDNSINHGTATVNPEESTPRSVSDTCIEVRKLKTR